MIAEQDKPLSVGAAKSTPMQAIDTLHVWLRRTQVDRAVVFGVAARVWQLFAGPVSVLLIASRLTPEVQGFYYTFGSLLALQSFLELNLYLVIINVASHEWSHLCLGEDGRIEGSPKALSRLVSLGRLILKWYAVASAVFVLGVGTTGFVFFAQRPHPGIAWQGPWVLLVILTGLQLWALPLNSLLEGCNQVATIQRFRLSQAVLSSVALWLTLALGGGLWALVISTSVGVLRDAYLLGGQYRPFFGSFFGSVVGPRLHWKIDIWPMQWRLALSGVVSYFAFNLFTPVMFQYHGATVAGQMGMTLTLVSAVGGIASMWLQPNAPRFGMLIAQKNYIGLDRRWLRVSSVSLAVAGGGAGMAWLVVYYANAFHLPLTSRLLSPLPTGLLLAAMMCMHVTNCQAVYLRAHKQEPLVVVSVVASLLIGGLVLLLGGRFGPTGAASAYLVVTAGLGVPWITAIWFRCRSNWHSS